MAIFRGVPRPMGVVADGSPAIFSVIIRLMTEIWNFIAQHPLALILVVVALVGAVLVYKIVKKIIKVALILAIAAIIIALLWKFGVFQMVLG